MTENLKIDQKRLSSPKQRRKGLQKNRYRLRDPQGNIKKTNRGIPGKPHRKRLKQRKV